MAWALFNAESNNDGKVETWEHHGLSDADLGNMPLSDAAEWALEEMAQDDYNAVVVSGDGTIEKWIMPAPAGENRNWW